jgi:hypothetical protein
MNKIQLKLIRARIRRQSGSPKWAIDSGRVESNNESVPQHFLGRSCIIWFPISLQLDKRVQGV